MIKIEDLDEFEGTTADMVRAWLRTEGWREEHQGGWVPPGRQIEGGLRVCCMADVITPTDGIPEMLTAIQHYTKRSPQSLLREINPRMRRGRPSQAERDAHEGPWLASLPGSHVLLVGTFSDDGETFFPGIAAPMRNTCEGAQDWMDAWSFWPCDQHGNKTRRGA